MLSNYLPIFIGQESIPYTLESFPKVFFDFNATEPFAVDISKALFFKPELNNPLDLKNYTICDISLEKGYDQLIKLREYLTNVTGEHYEATIEVLEHITKKYLSNPIDQSCVLFTSAVNDFYEKMEELNIADKLKPLNESLAAFFQYLTFKSQFAFKFSTSDGENHQIKAFQHLTLGNLLPQGLETRQKEGGEFVSELCVGGMIWIALGIFATSFCIGGTATRNKLRWIAGTSFMGALIIDKFSKLILGN